MTLLQLYFFREAAETLNFTKAAENQHVSQPNLSHAISALEEELETELFIRERGKKTALSPAGNVFFSYVCQSLDTLEEGSKAIEELLIDSSKSLKLSYSHVYGLVVVPTLLQEMKRRYPLSEAITNFTVIHSKTDVLKMLRDGDLDVAFTFDSGTNGIGTIPIVAIELKVMVPKEHPLAARKIVTIEDLAGEPLYCCNQEEALYEKVLNLFSSRDITPNIIETFPDWAPQFAKVSYGSGIIITPFFPMATDRIKILDLDCPDNTIFYNALYDDKKKLSKVVKNLLHTTIQYSIDHS